MMNTTLAQLRELKLHGMASAVDEPLSSGACTALSFEERLALMVDREIHHRGDKRRGHSALYLRTPRLAEDLRVLHGNGGFGRWLAAVARTDVLLLDDWGLAVLDGPTRADLMEVIDDRAGTRPTIVTSQLPVEHWHAWIGDATIADAILARLLSRSQRITLRGESMRPGKVTGVDIKRATALKIDAQVADWPSPHTTPKPSKPEAAATFE